MKDQSAEVYQIAIADDHQVIRTGICRIISVFPEFNVLIEADNGQTLLDKIDKSKVMPDICILDISMKVMDGFQTLQAIRKKYGDEMKVLILTMHDSEYSIIRMLRMGANGYLLKASEEDDLHTALKDIVTKGYYSSDLVSSSIFRRIYSNPELLPEITEKEMTFLRHCCSEKGYKEIAGLMNLSVKTIESYYKSLCDKLDIHTRQGLVMFAFRVGLVQ